MRFTAAQYDEAIQALQDGKQQLEPDGRHCAICTDGGHQAWECGFNPLYAMAVCRMLAEHSGILHETLHYLAGFEQHMGERVGPARVVLPPEERCAACGGLGHVMRPTLENVWGTVPCHACQPRVEAEEAPDA